MTRLDLIEILKAAEDGKDLQWSRDGNEPWLWLTNTREHCVEAIVKTLKAGGTVRVKPDPREWWAGLYSQGRDGQLFSSEAEARRMCPNGEIVRLREVLL